MLVTTFAALALVVLQDPAPGIANAPADRSEARARLDVCLYTPAPSRDPSCEPMLEAEAALVPDQAFAASNPSALVWANAACPTSRFTGAARTACRDEQRDLFRRAERARAALTYGAAGGVYAEAWGRPPAAASREGEELALRRDEQSSSGPCDRHAQASRDPDTGNSSSSYGISCSWSTGGEEGRERAREVLENVMRDD